MNKIFSALLILCGLTVYAQDQEPCCVIIGINPGSNSVTARNNSTGQLFTFRAEPLDIQHLKLQDAVTTNESYTYVTGINKIRKQYFAGPINLIQPKSEGASGLVNLEYEKPCCTIVNIESLEPCCSMITAQNKKSGDTWQFKVSKELGATLKTGEPVYTQTIPGFNEHAIVQSMYLSNTGVTNIFSFPVEVGRIGSSGMLSGDKWIMSNATDLTGNFGRLNTSFPQDVEWGIDVYAHPDRSAIANNKPEKNKKNYQFAPGNYDFRLNNVWVKNVPIERGKETRLKTGVLHINTTAEWNLIDVAGSDVITSGAGIKMLALPVGNYQVKLNGEVQNVSIKDGETFIIK